MTNDSTKVSEATKKELVIPRIIVGLGNPEPRYDRTRHNIGFAAIDALSKHWQIPLAQNRKFKSEYGEGTCFGSEKIRLLKPLTYMNNSGEAISAAINWFKISPESVLVIYDELDLPIGKTRLRLSGSAGGHNGIKSTISHLGTKDFPRLRIGIGKPSKAAVSNSNKHTVSHVLGRFSPVENQILPEILDFVVECTELCIRQGVEKAMNRCNAKFIQIPED